MENTRNCGIKDLKYKWKNTTKFVKREQELFTLSCRFLELPEYVSSGKRNFCKRYLLDEKLYLNIFFNALSYSFS